MRLDAQVIAFPHRAGRFLSSDGIWDREALQVWPWQRPGLALRRPYAEITLQGEDRPF
jgi:hypothetical protein